MVKVPNVTLTSFVLSFVMGAIVSIFIGDYPGAIGCATVVFVVVPIRYFSWKKYRDDPGERPFSKKRIVIRKK